MRREPFERALSLALGVDVPAQTPRAIGGGSINTTLRYRTSAGPIFVKQADPDAADMFAAEAAGLKALADANAIRVPKVLGFGVCEDASFLALEWLDFGAAGHASEARLGELLARQHRVTADRFGWSRDNTIGSTPQHNAWCDDWVRFLRERRLGYQLEVASRHGATARIVDRGRLLCGSLEGFFASYRPSPSLLHGDLWGGNWRADAAGQPVIFDPAVYFGDREADLAMTRLFGGFGSDFYSAYRSSWPLDVGADVRCDLYNLYHVLNHFNLFRGRYLAQAESMIEKLLAEIA
jgi:protein-ribulosamine 3-kinase